MLYVYIHAHHKRISILVATYSNFITYSINSRYFISLSILLNIYFLFSSQPHPYAFHAPSDVFSLRLSVLTLKVSKTICTCSPGVAKNRYVQLVSDG